MVESPIKSNDRVFVWKDSRTKDNDNLQQKENEKEGEKVWGYPWIIGRMWGGIVIVKGMC